MGKPIGVSPSQKELLKGTLEAKWDKRKAIGKICRTCIAADHWHTTDQLDEPVFCIWVETTSGKKIPKVPTTNEYGYKRVAVSGIHPAFHEIVNMALWAQRTQAKIELTYLNTRNFRSNSWDFGVLEVIENS